MRGQPVDQFLKEDIHAVGVPAKSCYTACRSLSTEHIARLYDEDSVSVCFRSHRRHEARHARANDDDINLLVKHYPRL